mgnify:CR=1 FL=1
MLQRSTKRDGIWDEHEAIAQAVNDGNGELAARLSEQHADRAREALVGQLQKRHSELEQAAA